jgi:hypothetical protein
MGAERLRLVQTIQVLGPPVDHRVEVDAGTMAGWEKFLFAGPVVCQRDASKVVLRTRLDEL